MSADIREVALQSAHKILKRSLSVNRNITASAKCKYSAFTIGPCPIIEKLLEYETWKSN